MDAGALAPVGGGKYNHDLPSSGANEHADVFFDHSSKHAAADPHDTHAKYCLLLVFTGWY
jgi:hypothetical protein